MSDPSSAAAQPSGNLPAATRADGPTQDDAKRAAREGDEPMSDVQRTTLEALSREAGVPFDAQLTTTGASRRISELQRAKDHDAEAARAAQGAPTQALPSDAGEEDPGAALDAPGTPSAIKGKQVPS